ncbi:MAG: hypothetical protein SFW63_05655 [Alphaproteobacteria bacterium]|nr:hypothetical protein [Alphaproteobacteria bacterium]
MKTSEIVHFGIGKRVKDTGISFFAAATTEINNTKQNDSSSLPITKESSLGIIIGADMRTLVSEEWGSVIIDGNTAITRLQTSVKNKLESDFKDEMKKRGYSEPEPMADINGEKRYGAFKFTLEEITPSLQKDVTESFDTALEKNKTQIGVLSKAIKSQQKAAEQLI